MANLVLILGQSGTGKSTSIRNMDSKDTFIIQVVNKPLPFKDFKKNYPLVDKTGKGKRLVSDDYDKIISCLKYLNNDKDIKNIIIDDFQYVISNEFMTRAKEKGFDKFTEMAQHYYMIIDIASRLREDLNVIFLSHNEQKEDGTSKVKTIGKLLDEKITIEGLFTIVLNTVIQDNKYYFQTQNNGFNTTKSPLGMFDEQLIENDLKLVTEKINEYYGG
ncbi:MAG: AAA family ATPase [Finegoldia magna]|nr:AAA family ATPase [Finegoldia magna]